jgi:hypothetical protein
VSAVIAAALAEKVTLTENGRRRTITSSKPRPGTNKQACQWRWR